MVAASKGSIQCARLLLEHDADDSILSMVRERAAGETTSQWWNIFHARCRFLHSQDGSSALDMSVKQGNAAMIELLRERAARRRRASAERRETEVGKAVV